MSIVGKFCTNCGAALNEGAKFCTKCGANVSPISEEAGVLPDQATPNHETVLSKAGKKAFAPLLLGAGAGLIACNLMVFSSLQNTMVYIAAFALSAKALTQNGFLRRLTSALLPKANNITVTAVMGGWTLGFAIFAIVSFLPGLRNGIWLGIMLMVAGGILLAVNKNRKGVTV